MPKVRIKFEPRDLWVGVYWDYSPKSDPDDFYDYATLDIYICIVPMLPIKLSWGQSPLERMR